MKVSYHWLQRYFDTALPKPEKIAELLTMHSFEVESIEPHGKDFVFDLKVMPDRSHDCFSHRGIAREVNVLTGATLKKEVFNRKELNVPESNVFRAEVTDSKICRRFSALIIEKIEVKDSPAWLKELLTAIGQRSINNVVDATNFVMFSLGQPIHAYDRALLTDANGGYKIGVRNARDGEKIIALDGKEYGLNADNPVITDENSDYILGIAGIKGGRATEIGKHTKAVILESANFNPVAIRKSAKRLGLRTEASVRFENGITPELTTEALALASALIVEIAGTEHTRVEGLFDWYPRKANPYKIGVSFSEIRNTLGIDIPQKDVEKILDRTGFSWRLLNPEKAIVELAKKLIGIPYKYGSSILYDAPRSFDCSSFTSYLYAEAGIAIPRITADQFVYGTPVEKTELRPGDLIFTQNGSGDEEIEFVLIATGEKIRQKVKHTKTVEFLPGTPVPEGVDHVRVYIGEGSVAHAAGGEKKKIVIENLDESLSQKNIKGYRRMGNLDEQRFVVTIPPERLDMMSRESFLVSGIKEDLIEEIGRIYGYENISPKAIKPEPSSPEINKAAYYADIVRDVFAGFRFSEVYTYAFRGEGEVSLQNPVASDKPYLRANLTSAITESLELNMRNADLLGLEQIKIFEIGRVFRRTDEYNALAFAIENTKAFKGVEEKEEARTVIAAIEQALGTKITFTQNGFAYEANFDEVIKKLSVPTAAHVRGVSKSFKFKAYSSYPFLLRDIAVFVPEEGDKEKISEIVKKETGDLLVQYYLFDTFVKQFPDSKKTSYAYRLVFQSMEKTLTDDEVNTIMNKITSSLDSFPGFEVR